MSEAPASVSTDPDDLGQVVIVGAGLVGASIGMALTRAGAVVHLVDRVRSHAVVAAGLGAGDVGEPDPDDVGLVVVAVPPAAAARVVRTALGRFRRAVVTDVASVKKAVLDDVLAGVRDASRYVGSHPMAGSHRSGPLTAVPELFVDRTWVVADRPDNPGWAVDRVETLARLCRARIVHLDPAEHDEAVAQVSHVPQLISTLMAAHLRDVPEGHLLLAGQGVRDVTRIAGSDPQLWRQIIAANSGAVRHELEGIRADLDRLLDHLDDADVVEDALTRGRTGAEALPGKHGSRTRPWTQVVVEIPDEPGSLARLFADIGAAGVNVEDLEIEHDLAREVGFLAVSVAPDREAGLREAMLGAGWSLRA